MAARKLLLILLILSLGFWFFLAKINSPKENTQKTTLSLKTTDSLNSFDEKSFYQAVDRAKEDNLQFDSEISAGVIPHHQVAGHLIAGFFKLLAKQNIHNLIILGPNHEEAGEFPILSTGSNWETPFGLLETNSQIVNRLLEKNLLKKNSEVIAKDQSIAALTPFIKYYLPRTQIVPLLLKRNLTDNQIQNLARSITQESNPQTVIIASIDFSHYLNFPQAQENDRKTIELIRNQEISKLLELDSGYLDSPASIAVLLTSTKILGKNKLEILKHLNSNQIQKTDSTSTTSYFVLVF